MRRIRMGVIGGGARAFRVRGKQPNGGPERTARPDDCRGRIVGPSMAGAHRGIRSRDDRARYGLLPHGFRKARLLPEAFRGSARKSRRIAPAPRCRKVCVRVLRPSAWSRWRPLGMRGTPGPACALQRRTPAPGAPGGRRRGLLDLRGAGADVALSIYQVRGLVRPPSTLRSAERARKWRAKRA